MRNILLIATLIFSLSAESNSNIAESSPDSSTPVSEGSLSGAGEAAGEAGKKAVKKIGEKIKISLGRIKDDPVKAVLFVPRKVKEKLSDSVFYVTNERTDAHDSLALRWEVETKGFRNLGDGEMFPVEFTLRLDENAENVGDFFEEAKMALYRVLVYEGQAEVKVMNLIYRNNEDLLTENFGSSYYVEYASIHINDVNVRRSKFKIGENTTGQMAISLRAALGAQFDDLVDLGFIVDACVGPKFANNKYKLNLTTQACFKIDQVNDINQAKLSFTLTSMKKKLSKFGLSFEVIDENLDIDSENGYKFMVFYKDEFGR